MRCRCIVSCEKLDVFFYSGKVYEYSINNMYNKYRLLGECVECIDVINVIYVSPSEFNRHFIDMFEYRDKQIGEVLDEV